MNRRRKEQEMKFDNLLVAYRQRFHYGSFPLCKGRKLSTYCKKEGVPNEPGVYVIYGITQGKRITQYIGAGGKLLPDGTFTNKKLGERIANTRAGQKPANKYYQDQMNRYGLDELLFEWFVTFDGRNSIIPAKAEADLVQAYYEDKEDKRALPPWNKKF